MRAAFASRRAFADARSEHPDGFNFGSAPNERINGGAAIKRVFGKLRAEIRSTTASHRRRWRVGPGAEGRADGRRSPPLNVDFTTQTRAATDLTQTFRVLAILLKEGADWRIVQTQWSHAR